MTDPSSPGSVVPLSHLPSEEKQKLSGSFGAVASHYERYRPGPPLAAIDWFLPSHVNRVVDLGAGTGALTRLLLGRAEDVVAVEPDDRMRAVLAEEVPEARALKGRGEEIPIADGSADAVLASSSWHWMDVESTLAEVARVLVPGGVLGAIWAGPDPEGAFLVQAQSVMEQQSRSSSSGDDSSTSDEFADVILGNTARPNSILEIPQGVPFDQPEHEVFLWEVPLNADDLIGLLGTFSWVITLADDERQRLFAEARRLLREFMGVEGDVTVDVAYRAEAWKSRFRG